MTTKTAVKEKLNGHSPSAVLSIPLSSIVVSMLEPQLRRREHFKKDEIQELADSILSMGLISPITVRPYNMRPVETPAGTDYERTYELVAGERRFLATKVAGLDAIDAVVRDLDDQQTIEIQLHENLKRLDVEPLDEAFSYKYLIDHAQILEGGLPRPYTVADIAAKFSRTEEIILRRLKLLDLIDDGREDLAAGKLPLAHAELIARFSESVQKNLLKNHTYAWHGGAVPYKSLQDAVEQHIVCDLNKAKFDVKDERLRTDRLVCGNCTERTGYSPGLFEGELGKTDHCMNTGCFKAKLKKSLQLKRHEIAQKLPNPDGLTIENLALTIPLLKNYYGSGKPLGDGIYLEDSNWRNEFKHVKKNECPFTEKALYVETEKAGSTTFICRSTECKIHEIKKPDTPAAAKKDPDAVAKQRQNKFDRSVLTVARAEVIPAYIRSFNSERTVFNDPSLRRRFLAAAIYLGQDRFNEDEGFKDAVNTIDNKEVRALFTSWNNDRADIEKVLSKITSDEESRLFAVIAFGSVGYYDDWDKEKPDSAPVRKMAEEIGLDYTLIDAVARRDLAMNEGDEEEAIMQAYLKKVTDGKAPAKPPALYWPKSKEEKKSAKKEVKK